MNIKDYFTDKNKYISSSKIKDWLKSKEFFKKLYITNEIKREVTDALIIGSAVDCWLTRSERTFRKKYEVVNRRATENPNYEFQLNDTMLKKIEAICRSVVRTQAYKDIRKQKYKNQMIIIKPIKGLRRWKGLCGIPDWFKVKEDGTCVIIDLKTTQDASPKKYFYFCLEYGYFLQAAMYRILLQYKYPQIKKFLNLHLVVEKDTDGINNVYTYELSDAKVDEARQEIEAIVNDIAAEKLFLPKPARWEDRLILGEEL